MATKGRILRDAHRRLARCRRANQSHGDSFDGYLLFCLAEFCKNGQLMAFQIYIAGEVNTSSEPDELSFTYAINLNCGGKLTCTENGTFKGTAKAARSTAWRDRSMVSKSGQ